MKEEVYKYKLLKILLDYVGKSKAIKMEELYEQVFGKKPKSKISGTRTIRKLVEKLRWEGNPIASTSESDGGGYYIAASGSEMEDYLSRLRKSALKKLALEAKLRKITLPELVRNISLNLHSFRAEGENE